MKQIIAYLIASTLSLLPTFAQQSTADEESAQYLNLIAQQQTLRRGQDSLQMLLSSARTSISTAVDDQKTTISQAIVRLESELFDIRTRVSQLGSQIAAIEEQYAENTLTQHENSPLAQSAVLYENPFFVNNLSPKDLSLLSSQTKVESEIVNALLIVAPLYAQVEELKKLYDLSVVQSEVDEIRANASIIKGQIAAIDDVVGDKWNALYNYLFDLYLVMLDKAPDKDRAVIEAIELESREVRRAETFKQNGSLTPKLSAFDLQRNLLLSYQKAIAKAASLSDAYNALSVRKIPPVQTSFAEIEFLPRVLTIYGPAMVDFTYPSANVADLPEMIIPEKGVYYSIQISLLSAPAKSVDMFKKVWPIQWQKTADGKYRYLVGGFHSYDAAAKSVATLNKAGFKYPVVLAFNNGQSTTVAKAKAAEKPAKAEGESSFKIVVVTKNPAAAETIKNTIETHAKGKSIVRLSIGDELQFTVTEFVVREEADIVAQILREKTEAAVTVEPIDIEQ